MSRPRLHIEHVRDEDTGEPVVPHRFRWVLIANGNVIATDGSQGYARRHRAREMGERVASGDYSDYVLVED